MLRSFNARFDGEPAEPAAIQKASAQIAKTSSVESWKTFFEEESRHFMALQVQQRVRSFRRKTLIDQFLKTHATTKEALQRETVAALFPVMGEEDQLFTYVRSMDEDQLQTLIQLYINAETVIRSAQPYIDLRTQIQALEQKKQQIESGLRDYDKRAQVTGETRVLIEETHQIIERNQLPDAVLEPIPEDVISISTLGDQKDSLKRSLERYNKLATELNAQKNDIQNLEANEQEELQEANERALYYAEILSEIKIHLGQIDDLDMGVKFSIEHVGVSSLRGLISQIQDKIDSLKEDIKRPPVLEAIALTRSEIQDVKSEIQGLSKSLTEVQKAKKISHLEAYIKYLKTQKAEKIAALTQQELADFDRLKRSLEQQMSHLEKCIVQQQQQLDFYEGKTTLVDRQRVLKKRLTSLQDTLSSLNRRKSVEVRQLKAEKEEFEKKIQIL